jgi:hypothetical protein
MWVKARHIVVSAVKTSYNKKNTAATGWEVIAEDAYSAFVYIFYTPCGDQVRYNSLFREQEG